jgi:phosphodiesterase/alkaline phosphatase D-like protein
MAFSSFIANWSRVSGATDYRLDVSTSNSFTTYVRGYQNLSVGNITSFPVTGLAGHTTYYYRMRAYSGCAAGLQFQHQKCTDVALRSKGERDCSYSLSN